MSYTKFANPPVSMHFTNDKIGLLQIQFQHLGLFAADAQELLSFFSIQPVCNEPDLGGGNIKIPVVVVSVPDLSHMFFV